LQDEWQNYVKFPSFSLDFDFRRFDFSFNILYTV